MRKYFNKIGLFLNKESANPYSYNHKDYTSKSKKKTEAHKEFLKSLSAEENNRLTIIENKTTQLVSQTGIIFSLLSLFIPILIDKVTNLDFQLKLVLLFCLIFSFLFYMLTIMNALKNFNVKNFVYSYPSPKNVLKYQDKKLSEFYAEEVQDLLYSLNQNLKVNNIKASNLLYSYTSFKIANTIMAISVGILCTSLLFIKNKKDSISIENSIKIEKFDSAMKEISNSINSIKKDTIYIEK